MRQRDELQRLEVSATLVDSRGRACPLPIVDLARALKSAALVELWADDPAAGPDLEAFAAATGHTLVTVAIGTPTAPRALRAVVARAGSR